jgi:hypothetical protein
MRLAGNSRLNWSNFWDATTVLSSGENLTLGTRREWQETTEAV